MKTKTTLILMMFTCVLMAQVEQRHYHSMDYLQELKKDTIYLDSLAALEQDIFNKLRFAEAKEHKLPLVFHVLFSNETERIDEAKILQQIEILNADFGGQATDRFEFEESEGDRRALKNSENVNTQIQFCLADMRGHSQLGTAIDYQHTFIQEWENRQMMKTEFGSPIKAPEQFINIWLCDLPDGVAGYAQMPHGPAAFDGIVMDLSFIKNIGNEENRYAWGHTLTHLMGNYLGLFPLWGEKRCEDDYVRDTPIHNAPNFRAENVQHVSTCAGYPTELINNFMDATDDNSLTTFTEGQKHRMQAILSENGPRAGLTRSSTNCDNPNLEMENYARIKNSPSRLDKNELKVYPNPASNRFFIIYENENFSSYSNYDIEIYSSDGKLMYQITNDHSCIESIIEVQNWPAGLYLIKIIDEGQLTTQKLIIE